MALILKRIICFIIKVTLALRKISSNNPSSRSYLPGPEVPRFILNLIQRE